jgi:hypothetical protein
MAAAQIESLHMAATETKLPSEVNDTDQLRNYICFKFLKSIPVKFNKDIEDYDSSFAYGNLYTKVLKDTENLCEMIFSKKLFDSRRVNNDIEELILLNNPILNSIDLIDSSDKRLTGISLIRRKLKELLDAIYLNDCGALELSYDLLQRRKLADNPGRICSELDPGFNPFKKTNKLTPHDADKVRKKVGMFIRLSLSEDKKGHHFCEYKPQHETRIVTTKPWSYKAPDHEVKEISMGTMAQISDHKIQVSPIFKAWLYAKDRDIDTETTLETTAEGGAAAATSVAATATAEKSERNITHVYFNCLVKHNSVGGRKGFLELPVEIGMTESLNQLEDSHPNIAVITFPSDNGLMAKSMLTSEGLVRLKHAKERIIDSALNNDNDFYISDEIKRILFKDRDEPKKLRYLLVKSAQELGLDGRTEITKAEQQALLFHFTKYEYTNYILKTLNPDTFNMSCKDGIDRAGVASLYYNLIKSIELGKPITEDEFKKGLDAAPTMVKGRGMNHHREIIWNVINNYINTNYDLIRAKCDWLIEWRNKNSIKVYQSTVQDFVVSDHVVGKETVDQNALSKIIYKNKSGSKWKSSIKELLKKTEISIDDIEVTLKNLAVAEGSSDKGHVNRRIEAYNAGRNGASLPANPTKKKVINFLYELGKLVALSVPQAVAGAAAGGARSGAFTYDRDPYCAFGAGAGAGAGAGGASAGGGAGAGALTYDSDSDDPFGSDPFGSESDDGEGVARDKDNRAALTIQKITRVRLARLEVTGRRAATTM